jgi:hypothetical protein
MSRIGNTDRLIVVRVGNEQLEVQLKHQLNQQERNLESDTYITVAAPYEFKFKLRQRSHGCVQQFAARRTKSPQPRGHRFY